MYDFVQNLLNSLYEIAELNLTVKHFQADDTQRSLFLGKSNAANHFQALASVRVTILLDIYNKTMTFVKYSLHDFYKFNDLVDAVAYCSFL